MKSLVTLLAAAAVSLPFLTACNSEGGDAAGANADTQDQVQAEAKPVNENLNKLRLPNGFKLEQLNVSLPNARQMALTEKGTLIVGTMNKGIVYAVLNALTDANPQVINLFEGLTLSSGVVVHEGNLYISANSIIIKVADIDNNTKANPEHTLLVDDLPDHKHHGWRVLEVGPDNHLYVSIGTPCNVCLSEDPRFATIMRVNPANGESEIWSQGVRYTAAMAFHPETDHLWFAINGRDNMGDDVPPEEINIATEKGQHFGYPFVHAGTIDDPEFGDHEDRKKFDSFVDPALTWQAHSAPLGIDFYTGDQFPAAYKNVLFMAEHGSYNRSSPVGYQISTVSKDADGNLVHKPFIDGWLQSPVWWGRPVDVKPTPDGSLLISDDFAGAIYRVSYSAP